MIGGTASGTATSELWGRKCGLETAFFGGQVAGSHAQGLPGSQSCDLPRRGIWWYAGGRKAPRTLWIRIVPFEDADADAARINRRLGAEVRKRQEALGLSAYALAKAGQVSDQTSSRAPRCRRSPRWRGTGAFSRGRNCRHPPCAPPPPPPSRNGLRHQHPAVRGRFSL